MATLNNYVNARVNPWGESGDEVVSALITHGGENYPIILVPNETDSVLGKYIIELPEVPDLSHAVTLYDLGTNGQGTPTAMIQKSTVNEMQTQAQRSFMLAPSASSRPHLVWVSNDMKNHYVGFSYYGKGQVLNAANLRDFICNTAVVKGQMNCNGLITPAANISDLYSRNGTVTINGNADITGGVTVGGKLSCVETIKGYVETFLNGPDFPGITLPADFNEWDEDRTWIYLSMYRYLPDANDDDYKDIYAGPLRYFLRHPEIYSSISLKWGTWTMYLYIIEYL